MRLRNAHSSAPEWRPGAPAIRVLVLILALMMVVTVEAGAVRAALSGMRLLNQPGRAADSQARAAGVTRAQYDAVRRAFGERLPSGTRMFSPQRRDDAWRQRILEFAVFNGVIAVADRGAADVEVSVVADPQAADGAGVRLVVESIG